MRASVRLSACFAVAAAVVSAQQARPPGPRFRTEVNYIRVDVYPTANDAPVTDLTQNDFEILEDGVAQKIEQFEHVVIRGPVPQDARREPNTVAESRQAVADSRGRLFILFLDLYHVDREASVRARKPLVDTLNQLIGPDDLVAVMTPDMSAKEVTFARRTTTIEGILIRAGWAERNTSLPPDQQDQMYATCYPNSFRKECQAQNGIAAEMIDRRHERMSLDALHDLVRFLRGVREERKAILAITDGWLLFRPNDGLMRSLDCAKPPVAPPLGIDPRNGRLTTNEKAMGDIPLARCEADRQRLAQLDSDREFRELMDEANPANASFYPIDPRGLAVFDTPLVRTDVPGPLPLIVPPHIDQATLKAREGSLRAAAALTDGMVVVGSNDLATGLKRITNDLSSYYLLGYYSSGKLDGKFHAISVRVKRPGVHVRARRGYLAGRAGDVANSVGGVAAPASAGASSIAAAATSAIAALTVSARDQPLRLHVVAGWKNGPDSKPAAVFWTVGEITDRISGAELDAVVTTADGSIG